MIPATIPIIDSNLTNRDRWMILFYLLHILHSKPRNLHCWQRSIHILGFSSLLLAFIRREALLREVERVESAVKFVSECVPLLLSWWLASESSNSNFGVSSHCGGSISWIDVNSSYPWEKSWKFRMHRNFRSILIVELHGRPTLRGTTKGVGSANWSVPRTSFLSPWTHR